MMNRVLEGESRHHLHRGLFCVDNDVIPLMLLPCHMLAGSGFKKTAKSDGESGHPCLVPL